MNWDTPRCLYPLFLSPLVRGTFYSQFLKKTPGSWRGPQEHNHSDPLPLSPPGQWMALPDFPDYHKWGFSLATLNSDVYVTGRWFRAPGDTLINYREHQALKSTLAPNRILAGLLRPSSLFYTSGSEEISRGRDGRIRNSRSSLAIEQARGQPDSRTSKN